MLHRTRVLILRIVFALAVVLLMAVMSCDGPESGPAESSLRMPVELLWKYEVPQIGIQNFFVEDGIVAVGGWRRYGGNKLRELHALDVETGSVLWSFTSGYGPSWNPDNIHLYNGIVYFMETKASVSPRGTALRAVDASTGDALWSYGPLSSSLWPPSLLVSEEAVYAVQWWNRYTSVVALNSETGALIWERSMLNSFPKFISDDVMFIQFSDDAVADGVGALDAATRELMWRREGNIYTATAEADGTVIVKSYIDSDGVVEGLNSKTGTLRWRYQQTFNSVSIQSVRDGIVIITSHRLSSDRFEKRFDDDICALDAKNGTELWCGKQESRALRYLGRGDGNVYSRSGNRVSALDAATGMELWSHDLEDMTVWLRILGGRPYVGARVLEGSRRYVGAIDALDPESGATVWQYQQDEGVSLGSLIVTNGTALVMTERGLMAMTSGQ